MRTFTRNTPKDRRDTAEKLTIPSGAPENFTPTRREGLTDAEAARLREAGQGNAVQEQAGKSVLRILADNALTFFNLLNVLIAAALAWVGAWRNMLFMGVVISNTVIGTVQEIRAHRAIHRLKLASRSPLHVIRGGREVELMPEETVKGDLVRLRAGDRVPADAICMGGVGAMNESLLTGESDAVSKQPGDWLMSGSFVASGTLTAQLERVGEESYLSRLTRSAKVIRRPKSQLMQEMARLIRILSVVIVPIGLLLFWKQYSVRGDGLYASVTQAAAAMIGMIPEGLMLLTSIALAVGVVRLSRRNTLVQELHGIETLARADVLCLDKTGTLTTGEMKLEAVIPLEADGAEVRQTAARFLGASDVSGATLCALAAGIPPVASEPAALLPFSSERKLSAVSFREPAETTLVLGAPSFVLGEAYAGRVRELAEERTAAGERVLALCACDGMIQGETLPPVRRVLGLLALSDCLRPHTQETLRYFAGQDVTVKLISGDDPRTVAALAKRAGVAGTGKALDVSRATEEELRAACEDTVVFGRVTPERKRLLVTLLQEKGHSVAMTGDGVNDIPALKTADCSIAIAGGSDAAKQAAQLTLLDADFASLPRVVAEGRRVINNVTRSASLFLVKTLYSLGLSLMLLILPASYPFKPIQLTLISAVTIGIPSFFLALQPNTDRVRGHFLRTVLRHAIPGAAAVAFCAALAVHLEHLGVPQDVCSTLAALSAGTVGLLVLLTHCLPFNTLRVALLAGMAALFTLAVVLFPGVFYLTPLGGRDLALLAGLTAGGAVVLFALRAWMQRMEKKRG